MLTPPTVGFAPSQNKVHRVRIAALAEWIEMCVVFEQKKVTTSEIVDILMEENLYRKQGRAKERIADALGELKRRSRCLAAVCPYSVDGLRVVQTKPWRDSPAFAFCLMLSAQVAYRTNFAKAADYGEQGVLFERLTAESLAAVGWKIHSAGWSKSAASGFKEKVAALAEYLGEPVCPTGIGRWTNQRAKDGGLDIVCHVPFVDGWAGRPVYFVQCASGEGWMDKRCTPVLSVWHKLVDMATHPRRGMAIPFALLADDFRKAANYDELSLLLDRHRISAPMANVSAGWTSPELANELNAWTAKKLKHLRKARAA